MAPHVAMVTGRHLATHSCSHDALLPLSLFAPPFPPYFQSSSVVFVAPSSSPFPSIHPAITRPSVRPSIRPLFV